MRYESMFSRPGSFRPQLQMLESRNTPGSMLKMSTIGADIGALYQAALGPVSQLEQWTQPTQEVAVLAPTATPSEVVQAPLQTPLQTPLTVIDNPVVHEQVFQTGLYPGSLAALGTEPSAGQLPISPLKTGEGGGRTQVVLDPMFAGGLPTGNPNWTVGDPTDIYVNSAVGVMGSEAVLGTVGTTNTLTQTCTTPAFFYSISFDLSCDDTGSPPGPNSFSVSWGGTTLVNFVSTGAFSYTHFTTPPIYTPGATTDIVITEQEDPSFYHLTNVHADG